MKFDDCNHRFLNLSNRTTIQNPTIATEMNNNMFK